MMDLCVGEKPKPIGTGALEDFNEIFIQMFNFFENHERIVTVWNDTHEEDPFKTFGSLAIASVRRWLNYYQLVMVKKEEEDDSTQDKDELLKKNGWTLAYAEDWKKWCLKSWRGYDKFFDHEPTMAEIKNAGCGRRNLTLIRPTLRGFQAYKNGLIIKVDWGSVDCSQSISVGIGKPYPESSTKHVETAYAIWDQAKISNSRQQNWVPELREYYLSNLDKKTAEALNMVQSWASAKAWDWNSKHGRRRRGIKDLIPPETQKRLFESIVYAIGKEV